MLCVMSEKKHVNANLLQRFIGKEMALKGESTNEC